MYYVTIRSWYLGSPAYLICSVMETVFVIMVTLTMLRYLIIWVQAFILFIDKY